MDPARKAYDHWKDADVSARAAEARLARAWEAYFAREGPPPPQDLIREVSRWRAVANERLSHAMATLSSARNGDSTFPGMHPGVSRHQEKGPRVAEAE